MFRRIPFEEAEMKVLQEIPGRAGAISSKIRNTPVSPRENQAALYYEKKPFWMPMVAETKGIAPSLYNINLGRGLMADSDDIFGLHWTYVASAGGSTIHPGNPLLDDANNWKNVVKIPDVASWDWDTAVAEVGEVDKTYPAQMTFINGFWFERLISFMDFMPAAMALIDEEQTDALKELFQATTDMACKLVDIFCEKWPAITEFNVHDDWGAQKAPFFSQDVAYELFVPYMKQLTDHIHSKGRLATLHSCGHTEDRVQAYIDGGFDQWTPQPMNNIRKLYEEYGDKMVFGVWPDPFDYENATEEEVRAFARKFVDDYSQPGKPAVLSHTITREVNEVFLDEVYRYSRKLYAER